MVLMNGKGCIVTNDVCDSLWPLCRESDGHCIPDEDGNIQCNCPARKTYKENEGCLAQCNENSDCKNGGKCIKTKYGMLCSCLEGSEGRFCEQVPACKTLQCGTDAECKYLITEKSAKCICKDQKLTFDRDDKKCRAQCKDDGDCKNGGICQVTKSGMFCSCLQGTEGHFCEYVSACKTLHCGIDAVCKYNITETSAKCKCKDQKLIFDKDDKNCKAQCTDDSNCKNGGNCEKKTSGMFCKCWKGTEGHFCEDVPACKTFHCGTDAVCKYNITDKSAKCRCKDQKLIFDKDDKKCKAPCYDDTDCMNGGKCNSHTRGNFCSCLEGTEGHYCRDVPACKFLSCGTDALCSYDVTEQSAKCKCDDPNLTFIEKSKKCVKGADQCANHVCENGGTCIVYNDGPKCLCKSSFSGDRCEIGGRDEIKRLCLLIWILCSIIILSIVVISCLTVSRCRKDGGMKNGIC